jgi:hypothetical protein
VRRRGWRGAREHADRGQRQAGGDDRSEGASGELRGHGEKYARPSVTENLWVIDTATCLPLRGIRRVRQIALHIPAFDCAGPSLSFGGRKHAAVQGFPP